TARAIHQLSNRADRPFVEVACGALPDTLLESELFGHEKGAFTGADRRHIGKFEQCNQGTIFLDEVGDMSPLTQAKVLRLLQEKKFERVGGKETIEVDVRVISATNKPLEQMIKDNEFRLDLFHRLNAFEIRLPPLHERGDDFDLLINHFLSLFNRQLEKNIVGFSEEALAIFKAYPWPGNIRELQSTIRKCMLMATGPVILPEFLPRDLLEGTSKFTLRSEGTWNGSDDSFDLNDFISRTISEGRGEVYSDTLAAMERVLLRMVLQHHGGNQSRAAEQLGITRGSLRNKIRSLGISIEHVISAGD
ncbi:MAG: sigma-54 dependent transcriptional regulator, partial [Pirellulaceae bacterium]